MRHDAEFIVKDFCNISELIRHSVSLYTKRDEVFFPSSSYSTQSYRVFPVATRSNFVGNGTICYCIVGRFVEICIYDGVNF